MQTESTHKVRGRIAGGLALVAALTLALAPSSALAAPAQPKPQSTSSWAHSAKGEDSWGIWPAR
jgi:hypothetical protein